MKYNLGCGLNPIQGYVNVDYKAWKGVDLVMDLNKEWNIPGDSADEILASHVIEHIDSIEHFMRESHRVLKLDGLIVIRTPFGNSFDAMCDFTHKRPIYPETFGSFFQEDNTLFRTRSLQESDLPKFKYVSSVVVPNWWIMKKPKFIHNLACKFRNYIPNIIQHFEIQMKKV